MPHFAQTQPSRLSLQLDRLQETLTMAWRLGLVATMLLAGCARSNVTPTKPVGFEAGAPYALACQELAQQRAREIGQKRFLPPQILIHRWPTAQKPAATKTPKTAAPTVAKTVSEAELVERLHAGQARGTLVLARGGSGKSKLAWSLEAELCGRMPVARVDLQWDLPAAEGKSAAGNPVLRAAMRALHLNPKGPLSALRTALAARKWVLLLDSLDEIPLTKRGAVVAAVNDAMKAYPALRIVVFTRPPVFHGNYGLAHVDALVELPQLSCARAHELQKSMLPSAESRAAFTTFTKRYGLHREVKTDEGRCYYPHIATYRDFFVLKRIVKSSGVRSTGPAPLLSSRAQVYAFYLSVLLVKDLQGVNLLPEKALLTVDRMVAAQKPAAGVRNLRFTMAHCLAALTMPDKKAQASACERLMQSSLFAHAPQQTNFKLSNQSIADLFMARHTAGLVTKTGCSVVNDRAALFESNEVAGFLAGLPAGQRCVLELTSQLCRSGGFAQHNFAQLDQGLPAGSARLALLRTAQEKLPKHAQPDICVTATFERLRKAATGQDAAAPESTPAPAAPGK